MMINTYQYKSARLKDPERSSVPFSTVLNFCRWRLCVHALSPVQKSAGGLRHVARGTSESPLRDFALGFCSAGAAGKASRGGGGRPGASSEQL